jgi:hypothetical protein
MARDSFESFIRFGPLAAERRFGGFLSIRCDRKIVAVLLICNGGGVQRASRKETATTV